MNSIKMNIGNIKYIWHPEKIPTGPIAGVHALLLTSDGRTLVRIKNGEARLTGGRVDPGEEGHPEKTLIREIMEEAQCKINWIYFLGYQEVINGKNHENHLRAIARIEEILPAQPDPDRTPDWTYGRELVPPEVARKLYRESFGEIGEEMVNLGYKKGEFLGWFEDEETNTKTEVINPEKREK